MALRSAKSGTKIVDCSRGADAGCADGLTRRRRGIIKVHCCGKEIYGGGGGGGIRPPWLVRIL